VGSRVDGFRSCSDWNRGGVLRVEILSQLSRDRAVVMAGACMCWTEKYIEIYLFFFVVSIGWGDDYDSGFYILDRKIF